MFINTVYAKYIHFPVKQFFPLYDCHSCFLGEIGLIKFKDCYDCHGQSGFKNLGKDIGKESSVCCNTDQLTSKMLQVLCFADHVIK